MIALRLSSDDDVAILLQSVSPGQEIGLDGVVARDAVPSGHKIALRALRAGTEVKKYGWAIGVAKADIAAGELVHEHNLAFTPTVREVAGGSDLRPVAALGTRQFDGFYRANGAIGTRNYVGVLTSVNCSASVARRIAAGFHEDRMADYAHVDGVAAFTHATGCGTAYTGDGVENLQRTLAGYANHPNFHSVVIIGLGCEVNQIDRLINEMGLERSDRLKTFTIQDVGGTAKAIEHGRGLVGELIQTANEARRAPAPVSTLTLGLQCGGSDGWP
jgi:altronate hydrolase